MGKEGSSVSLGKKNTAEDWEISKKNVLKCLLALGPMPTRLSPEFIKSHRLLCGSLAATLVRQ